MDLAHIFGFGEYIPSQLEPFRTFIWGPLGGTIACCYILLAFIAWFPFQRKVSWARNAFISAFGDWIILDSVVCFRCGVCFQIYLIIAFSFSQNGLPIVFTFNNPGLKNPKN
jgi:hypothetical protein